MATKQTGRTHTKTIGEKPHTGRRYVQGGKVRIEWYEDGKRRSRTVGPHTPEMRNQADTMLEDLLAGGRAPTSAADSDEKSEPASHDVSFRELALLLLDAADQLADGIRNAGQEIMKQFSEQSDEPDENDSAK